MNVAVRLVEPIKTREIAIWTLDVSEFAHSGISELYTFVRTHPSGILCNIRFFHYVSIPLICIVHFLELKSMKNHIDILYCTRFELYLFISPCTLAFEKR